ncbi:MAG: hypothetical protein OXG46_04900 [Chloroflexi bacterium]|nr:hypothetical protein [Chloroflexota bacterium]MCY3937532.1 hypothetical protein [Chloroflexota bacterium]
MFDTSAAPKSSAARLKPYLLAVLLVIAGAIPWVLPATLLPVYWTKGSAFELGPFPEGWSLTQEIETRFAGHIGFSFSARPEMQDGRTPELEIRLEDGDEVLWANRVRIDSKEMKRFTVTFPVVTTPGWYFVVLPGWYQVRIRVLETGQGGVVFRGANSLAETSPYVLNVMDAGQPDHLTLDFQVLRADSRPASWFAGRPPTSPVIWLIAFGLGASIVAPLLASWLSDLRRCYSSTATLTISLFAACALVAYIAVIPIIQAGGLGTFGVSRLRLVLSMAAFPLAFALSHFLFGLDLASRANGSRNVLYRGLLVVSRIPLHWLRGWRLICLWIWRYVLRWWRGAPLILAVLSGIYIAAGDYPTADLLAKSAVVSLIPAAFWPRKHPDTNCP